MNPIWYAILAIVLIGVLVEVYPPLGWSLAGLAAMLMIVNYYKKGVTA